MTDPHAAETRAERLRQLISLLGDALTTQAVGDSIVSRAGDLFGSAYATVMLLSEEGRTVRFLRLQPIPDDVARLIAEVPRESPSATADALVKREPVFHRSLAEYLADYPHLAAATRALGVRALAHLPLEAGGRVIGVLSLSWVDERDFDPPERRFLATAAGHTALAFQRAELYEQKSEMATVLQRAVLPRRLPVVRDFRLAARYLPAELGVEVGGDWYDAFAGPDGRLWISVGDVGGHGVEAASVMGQLRNAIRAVSFTGLGPAATLDVVDRMLAAQPETSDDTVVATAVVGVLDRETGRLSWSSAGHMPPVLMRAEEEPVLLEELHGPLLGVGLSGRRVGEVTLGPGDMLVLYTDGLVEVRDDTLEAGMARLLAALRQPASAGPSAAADRALAASLAGVERRDDLCVLAVQRGGDDPRPAGDD
ncbi:MAG TPA: SpoIIE family protein phosphatase [Acidimicrobiales bacterium]|nr:SpoIIE family protein phosphatase [Acidimicrobiales bacterium]